MNLPHAAAMPAASTLDLGTIKGRQQAAWSSGDYAVVGNTLQIVGETLCEAIDLRSTERVLDVDNRGAAFDVVAANLPQFAAEAPAYPEHSPYWSSAGADGRRLMDPFLAGLGAHLAPGGWVLFSIATFLDYCPSTGVAWHRTVRPREWWVAKFASLGFVESAGHPFGPYDWLRGSGNGRYDWKPEDGMGFHIALRRAGEAGA